MTTTNQIHSLFKDLSLVISDGLLERLPCMAAVIELHTAEIIDANSLLLDQLGHKADEVIGKTIFDFVMPEDMDRTMEAYYKFENDEMQITFFTNHWKHKDGHGVKMFWITDTASSTRFKNYNIILAVKNMEVYA